MRNKIQIDVAQPQDLFMNDDPDDTALSPARAPPSDGLNDQCLPCGATPWNDPPEPRILNVETRPPWLTLLTLG